MTDVVDLILQDHRELQRMFEELQSDPSKRRALAPVMSTLLFAHSRAEESEVYPGARAAGGEEDVEHSQEEHLLADKLLAKLADTDPASPEFDSALTELVEAVSHHVEEEESKVLPGLRRLSADRRAELAEAFLASRAEHLGDQPGDIRKSELDQQAANIGLDGASAKSKDELAQELSSRAEE